MDALTRRYEAMKGVRVMRHRDIGLVHKALRDNYKNSLQKKYIDNTDDYLLYIIAELQLRLEQLEGKE